MQLRYALNLHRKSSGLAMNMVLWCWCCFLNWFKIVSLEGAFPALILFDYDYKFALKIMHFLHQRCSKDTYIQTLKYLVGNIKEK